MLIGYDYLERLERYYYDIEEIIIPSDYDGSGSKYYLKDICLIRLKKPAFGIKPLELTRYNLFQTERSAAIFGWGNFSFSQNKAPISVALRTANVTVQPCDTNHYEFASLPENICALGSNGESACKV